LVAKFGKVELAKGRNGYRKEARERERESRWKEHKKMENGDNPLEHV